MRAETQYRRQIVHLHFFYCVIYDKTKALHHLPSVLILITGKSGNYLHSVNTIYNVVVVMVCKENSESREARILAQGCQGRWILSDCNSVSLNGWVFGYELSGCGFKCSCSYLTSDITPASSKEFLDAQATTECRFTLKTRRWHDKNIQIDELSSLIYG